MDIGAAVVHFRSRRFSRETLEQYRVRAQADRFLLWGNIAALPREELFGLLLAAVPGAITGAGSPVLDGTLGIYSRVPGANEGFIVYGIRLVPRGCPAHFTFHPAHELLTGGPTIQDGRIEFDVAGKVGVQILLTDGASRDLKLRLPGGCIPETCGCQEITETIAA